MPRNLATKMSYCLEKSSIVEIVGKRGNAYLYQTTLPFTLKAE
jgi:hypothetical protein